MYALRILRMTHSIYTMWITGMNVLVKCKYQVVNLHVRNMEGSPYYLVAHYVAINILLTLLIVIPIPFTPHTLHVGGGVKVS